MTEKSLCNNLDIDEKYKQISENIQKAMQDSRRNDKVRLMAVTKTVSVERVNHAASLGILLLGENRVQEFLSKYDNYDKNCEIHFIGGLQNNKVKYIIDKVTFIHSVDNQKLAAEISRRAAALGRKMNILLEVNIGGEESKGGIAPEQLHELACYCSELEGVRVRGLMTIPPPNDSERYFEKMQRLFEDERAKFHEQFDTLSMGMSADYVEAIKHGSTIVRIGSLLFGYRK